MPTVKLSQKELIIDMAGDVHFEGWPSWTVDELLLHPKQATELCDVVRQRLRWKPLNHPDDEILRAYLNARKQSKLPQRVAASKPRPRRKS